MVIGNRKTARDSEYMSKNKYPFIPKKASEVEDGDFFYVPLSNGKFACGRLLLIQRKSGRKTKSLLVGLHNWIGKGHPSNQDIHNSDIIEQGVMHINSIGYIEGEVIGNKPLIEDHLKPCLQFEAGYLLDGFENLGSIPADDCNKYSRRSTYGLGVIKLLAEKHFVESKGLATN